MDITESETVVPKEIPKLEVSRTGHGYAYTQYSVKLISGSWPNEQDLIDICDNGMDPMTGKPLRTGNNFGGKVTYSYCNKKAEVKVYID